MFTCLLVSYVETIEVSTYKRECLLVDVLAVTEAAMEQFHFCMLASASICFPTTTLYCLNRIPEWSRNWVFIWYVSNTSSLILVPVYASVIPRPFLQRQIFSSFGSTLFPTQCAECPFLDPGRMEGDGRRTRTSSLQSEKPHRCRIGHSTAVTILIGT